MIALPSWMTKKRSRSTPREPIEASALTVRSRLIRALRARFDVAQTTEDNRRHWMNADALSADAALSPEIRATLRNRARYEVANNTYARGIVNTLANDVIGTGPRLHMRMNDKTSAQRIEREFMRWAKAINLAGKLRTMRKAKGQDGEAFAVMVTNRGLRTPVKLDLRLVEADQVTTPDLSNLNEAEAIDGIRFDQWGNPIEYHVLRQHPGDLFGDLMMAYDRVPATKVLHWFDADRPGQSRGLPDIMPALPLFAQLRRYTLAVIAAAETAADFAAVLYTDAPADSEADDVEPLDSIEIEKRMLMSLPFGWKMSQLKAEQPVTTYRDFKREIIAEIARVLNMPYNVAAGDSSDYNYASGRLDHQTYFKSIEVQQVDLECRILDRIFDEWMTEAILIDGYLPQAARTIDADLSHLWFWDGHEHVDPAKEANAQASRLQHHTTTLAAEFAAQGKDWEVELRQRAREIKLMDELGLSHSDMLPQRESEEATDGQDAKDAA